ncbi:hypothetical protein V9T40_006713 [Parthenolecanium corni]|uniref:Uncharacterized protein n=1 Tax=Parthenolecanium corni TaxID=536013 RepID=A0AAN9TP87_9HEMI
MCPRLFAIQQTANAMISNNSSHSIGVERTIVHIGETEIAEICEFAIEEALMNWQEDDLDWMGGIYFEPLKKRSIELWKFEKNWLLKRGKGADV